MAPILGKCLKVRKGNFGKGNSLVIFIFCQFFSFLNLTRFYYFIFWITFAFLVREVRTIFHHNCHTLPLAVHPEKFIIYNMAFKMTLQILVSNLRPASRGSCPPPRLENFNCPRMAFLRPPNFAGIIEDNIRTSLFGKFG